MNTLKFVFKLVICIITVLTNAILQAKHLFLIVCSLTANKACFYYLKAKIQAIVLLLIETNLRFVLSVKFMFSVYTFYLVPLYV